MKQLFRTGTNKYIVENIPAPQIGDGELLIEVRNSLISSGTETMSAKGSSDSGLSNKVNKLYSNFDRAVNFLNKHGMTELVRKLESRKNISVSTGYSVSGVVINKGKNITDIEIGDSVAAAGSGIASHGEIVAIPKNLVAHMPEGVSFKEASFTTVGSIALQGVRQANVNVAETVVVIGLGLIGLITVQILKIAGCKVIGIDLHRNKVEKALQIGADIGLVNGENTVVNDVLKHTDNLGADCVIICAGTQRSQPVNDAMSMVRQKGRVVVVGAVGMDLQRSPFYQKEVEFTISCSYGPGRYDKSYEDDGIDYPAAYVRWTENRNMQAFLWMLENKKLDLIGLVTDKYSIDDAPLAFEKILTDPENTLAVLLEYPERVIKDKICTKIITNTDRKIKKVKSSTINIGIIGAGSFARRTYLPFIYRNNNLNLKAIATKSGKNAKKIAMDYKSEYCTTDYKEIIQDESIDAVIITARHNLHYQMALEAIQSNKHVLLEKPMAMNEEQLDQLTELVSASELVFAVGYNRRYSPLAVKMKNLISSEITPVIINYRINAGQIPLSSWVQSKEEGGGRIIGEGCHFFDFVNYLIPGHLVNVSAEKCPVDSRSIIANDNYITVLAFDDGSLATVTYTSMGHTDMPKEYVEVFVNGKSMILNDFTSLKFYGFKEEDIVLNKMDKGQEAQLDEFSKKILGKKSSLILLEDSDLATRVSIIIDRILSE